jgi:catechol 2,3-dioxygenase-like lactoylglutathione lyase family enzyme
MGLSESSLIAFVPTRDLERARHFYQDQLGLRLVAEQFPFALVFEAGGIMLRVIFVQELMPAPYTQLGWDVTDIRSIIADLSVRGVRFEKYPGLEQDELGIWTAPNGDRVSWFRDPDGNVLSVSQHV